MILINVGVQIGRTLGGLKKDMKPVHIRTRLENPEPIFPLASERVPILWDSLSSTKS